VDVHLLHAIYSLAAALTALATAIALLLQEIRKLWRIARRHKTLIGDPTED
jgi:hypothetical protein